MGAFDGRDMSDGEFCIVCGASPPLTTDRMCESCLRDRTSLSVMPEGSNKIDVQNVVFMRFVDDGR